MPGKTISHQFGKRNVWCCYFGFLLLAFKAPRATCGNAQKTIFQITAPAPNKCGWVRIYKPLLQGAVRSTRRGKWLLFMEPRLRASLQIVLRRCKNSNCDLSEGKHQDPYHIHQYTAYWDTCIEATAPESLLKEWLRECRLTQSIFYPPVGHILFFCVCLLFLMTNFMWSSRLPDSSQLHPSHCPLLSGGCL